MHCHIIDPQVGAGREEDSIQMTVRAESMKTACRPA